MTAVLGIDPGNIDTAWALIRTDSCRVLNFGKSPNAALRERLQGLVGPLDAVAVEMVASYGMPVGREVFDTCVWVGRFTQVLEDVGYPVDLMFRREVKLNLCGSVAAKDSNIRQALVDRFAAGQPNHGKGTKALPGWFHGFHSDVWAAYAVAVTRRDQHVRAGRWAS